jgi:hypothetical protein
MFHLSQSRCRIAFVSAFAFCLCAGATIQSNEGQLRRGVKTDASVYVVPPAPTLPRAGGKFFDAVFGTEIMRASDERSQNGASCGTVYSYWSTFNADNTRLLVATDAAPWFYVQDFDASAFTLGARHRFGSFGGAGGVPDINSPVWDTRDPAVFYALDSANRRRLLAFNVSTGASALVHDFSRELRGVGTAPFLFQLHASDDDDVFSATIYWAESRPRGYLAWRRSTDTVLKQVNDVTGAGVAEQNEVEIDKTGRYLLVDNDPTTSIDVWDLQAGTKTTITDTPPDYAPSHFDCGHGFALAGDDNRNRFVSYSLATPHAARELLSFGEDWSQGAHLSMLAANEEWGLVSTFTSNKLPSVGRFTDEIFEVKLDGSRQVRRLLHHHSIYASYYDSPRANISRDGRFVAFTSNWGHAGGRRDLFVARIEPAPEATQTRPRRATTAHE